MAISVGEIEATLRLKDELTEPLRKSSEAFKDVKEHLDGVAEKLGLAGEGATGFGKAVGLAAVTAGAALAAVAVAVAAVTTGIVHLGEEGSSVNDVTEAFRALNARMGTDSEAALAALRRGTAGAITDFDLMKATNKALSAGLKLSADDMGVVAQASRALAKQGAIPLEEAFTSVMGAMTTGRVRTLAAMGAMVEMKGASAELKAQLQAEGDGASTNSDMHAKRQAVLEALRAVVERTGDQEIDFKEKMEHASVTVRNFVAALEGATARSPVLGAALDAVGGELRRAFGNDQATQVQTMVHLFELFAQTLVNWGQGALQVVGAASQAFGLLKLVVVDLIATFTLPLQLIPSWHNWLSSLHDGALQAAQGTDAMHLKLESAYDSLGRVGTAMQHAAADAQVFDNQQRVLNAALDSHNVVAITQAMVQMGNSGNLTTPVMHDLGEKLATLKDNGVRLTPELDRIVVASGAARAGFGETSAGAENLSEALKAAKAVVAALTDSQRAQIDAGLELGKSTKDIATAMHLSVDAVELYKKSLEGLVQQWAAVIFKNDEFLKQASNMSGFQFSQSGKGLGLYQPPLELDKNGNSTLLQNQFTPAMAGLYMMGKTSPSMGPQFDPNAVLTSGRPTIDMKALLSTGQSVTDGVEFGAGLGHNVIVGFQDTFKKSFGPAVIGAIQGGGSVTKSVASAFGGSLTQSIFGGDEMQATITKKFGDTFGGALNAFLPGVGALLGPLVGKIGGMFSNLFGGAGAKTNKERDGWIEQYVGIKDLPAAQEALRKMAGEAGATDAQMRALFDTKDAKAFEAAAGAVTAQIDAFKKKQEEAAAAAAKQAQDAQAFIQGFPQLLKQVSDSGVLASQSLRDMIAQVGQTKDGAAAVADFVKTQLSGVAAGLTTYLTASTTGYAKQFQLETQLGELRASLATADESQKAAIQDKINETTGLLEVQQQAIATTAVTTQGAADAMSAAMLGAFGEMQKQGVSAVDAIKQLGPANDALAQQMFRNGLTASDAFKSIGSMVAIMDSEIAGPAVTGVLGLNQALVGLSNTGILNQEMFAGLSNQITQTMGGLVAQGYDGAAALQLTQPALQTMWELEQDFGYQADAATNALLDQGVAAGLVGDKHREAQDRIAAGIDKLVALMGAFLATFGPLPAAIGTVATAATDATVAVAGLAGAGTDVADVVNNEVTPAVEDIPDNVPVPWKDWKAPMAVVGDVTRSVGQIPRTVPEPWSSWTDATEPGDVKRDVANIPRSIQEPWSSWDVATEPGDVRQAVGQIPSTIPEPWAPWTVATEPGDVKGGVSQIPGAIPDPWHLWVPTGTTATVVDAINHVPTGITEPWHAWDVVDSDAALVRDAVSHIPTTIPEPWRDWQLPDIPDIPGGGHDASRTDASGYGEALRGDGSAPEDVLARIEKMLAAQAESVNDSLDRIERLLADQPRALRVVFKDAVGQLA